MLACVFIVTNTVFPRNVRTASGLPFVSFFIYVRGDSCDGDCLICERKEMWSVSIRGERVRRHRPLPEGDPHPQVGGRGSGP